MSLKGEDEAIAITPEVDTRIPPSIFLQNSQKHLIEGDNSSDSGSSSSSNKKRQRTESGFTMT